jgi:hypothetical protein
MNRLIMPQVTIVGVWVHPNVTASSDVACHSMWQEKNGSHRDYVLWLPSRNFVPMRANMLPRITIAGLLLNLSQYRPGIRKR